jgi:hypothetical protein
MQSTAMASTMLEPMVMASTAMASTILEPMVMASTPLLGNRNDHFHLDAGT